MKSAKFSLWTLLAVFLLGATLPAQPGTHQPCPQQVDCGEGDGKCSNVPFRPTSCWPTRFGPAAADVVRGPANFLYCSGGTYALCFFSGPERPTGNSDTNNPLPCVYDETTGFADCTCQAYTSGAYFVDINAILNEGIYFQTIDVCGADGSRCKNIVHCGRDGENKQECSKYPVAPVCSYVNNQDPARPAQSFIPNADLISTFSFAMSDSGDYTIGSQSCNGLYAGCMTAPCTNPNGSREDLQDGDLVDCSCPTFNGDFQVGQDEQPGDLFRCLPASSDGSTLTWSASNTVTKTVLKNIIEWGKKKK